MKKILWICLSVLILAACSGKEEKLFSKAQVLADKGAFEKAIQAYSVVLKNNPENYAAYASRGLLYERLTPKNAQQLKKNKQLAERDYLKAIEINYTRPEIFNNLAALYIEQGRYEEALGYLNHAIALNPDYFMALVNRGVVFSQQGKLNRALLDFARAEALNKTSPLVYLNRGLAQFREGYYAGAVDDYTTLTFLDENNPRAYLERGRAFVKMGYFQNAMDDFQKAIAAQPDYALAYYYAAELLFSKGETDEAVAYAQQSKLLAPNYAPVYDMMGDMLALSSPVEATQHYLAARRLDPLRAEYYQNKIRMMTTENGRKRVVADRFLEIGK